VGTRCDEGEGMFSGGMAPGGILDSVPSEEE